MELRRGVMVTPKFLALVFPVRIGAAQQNRPMRIRQRTNFTEAFRGCGATHKYPRGVMVAAID